MSLEMYRVNKSHERHSKIHFQANVNLSKSLGSVTIIIHYADKQIICLETAYKTREHKI